MTEKERRKDSRLLTRRLTDERLISLLAGWATLLLGLAGVVLNFVALSRLKDLATKTQVETELILRAETLTWVSAFVFGGVLVFGYAAFRMRNSHGQLEAQLAMDEAISASRMELAKENFYYLQYADAWQTTDPALQQLNVETSSYLDRLLAGVCELFDSYTGEQCGACIKVFTFRKDNTEPCHLGADDALPQYVYTIRRDERSHGKRRSTDRAMIAYPYAANTAFSEIINNRQGADYFVCNDLPSLEAAGKYGNINSEWKKFYDATIVVPIKPPDSRPHELCGGFLCVDNFGGKFDQRCLYILEGIATDLYHSLQLYTKLRQQRSA